MTPESLATGLKHHQAGQLDQAEQVYRRILRVDPKHPDALHLLGVVGHQRGQADAAVALIAEAITVNGTNPLYHSNLGAAYQSAGRPRDAAGSFRRAVELNPRYVDAHFNLGVALESLKELDGAEASYRQALGLNPEHVESHNNLGNVLKSRGRLADAERHYRAALAARPNFAPARFNLGTVLQLTGDLDGSEQAYLQAITDRPDYAEAYDNLGLIHSVREEFDQAYARHCTAAELRPDFPQAWLHRGSAAVHLDRLTEAGDCFARCRVMVSGRPDAGVLPANLALAMVELARALNRQDDSVSARKVLEQARELDPRAADVLFELGRLHEAAGELEPAALCFERGLALQPANAAGYCNLGNVRAAQQRLDEAIDCYQRALQHRPNFAEAAYNLGNAYREQRRDEEAIRCYRDALRMHPGLASAHNNLGSVLQSQNRLDEAAESYRRAIQHQPDFATAHNNLGNVLQTLGQIDDAARCFESAVRIDPRDADVHNNLGVISSIRLQWDQACNHFRTALALSPEHSHALVNLGTVLKSQGKIEEGREVLEQALARSPSNKLRILLATLLPPLYESHADLRAWRDRFTEGVEALVRQGVTLDPDREALPSNFYLAFQGHNDVWLQQQIAQLYPTRDCRGLQRPDRDRIRIGFLSRHFRAHTIGRFMHGVIAGLNRDDFEVVVFSLGASNDPLARKIRDDADQFITLPESLPAARQLIAAEHLDILFFADLGMDPVTYSLAFTRFAPVQCVTWGHPVTTGIPTVDYFLSSELLEPSNADQHYSEQLVRLRGLPTVYARPALPDPLKPRSAFGLPDAAHLYLCPQSLFKFHPDFDSVLGAILDRDPDGRLVLLEGDWPHWTEALANRLQRTLGASFSRVQFLPRQNYPAFLNLLALGDVMLDPLHFGGGNTTFEGLSTGIPIVTLPGEFLRGRVTFACYQRMGVYDCVASSVEEYIDLAVRLGTDPGYSRQVRDRINATRRVLFHDTSVLRELEDFFRLSLTRAGVPLRSASLQAKAETHASDKEAEPPSVASPGPEADSEIPEARPLAELCPASSRPWNLAGVLQSHPCPACGQHVAVPFYDGGPMPLTTLAWPRTSEDARAMPRLPHAFVRCVDCGHVFNSKFEYANVPYSEKPNLMFNRGVLWSEHLQTIRDLILERLGPTPTVVEIGCGDGHLLRALQSQRPAGRYIGFDPSGAIDDGGGAIEARRELFLPEQHLAEIRPSLIVSRHVLEHLMNPLGFVQALGFACSWEDANTLLLIETPCIDQVFASGRTVDFFYEHNSHFTTESLRRLLLRCASEVELIETSYNGEVVYGLARFRRREDQVGRARLALQFRDRAQASRAGVQADLSRLAASGKRIAIWGGTGKAAAFINQYGLDAGRFPLVVDSDPDKSGTCVPGMGQEIRHRDVLRDSPVDVIIIATQWRAGDIVLEMNRCGIHADAVLLEHQGRLVDFNRDPHPYRRVA